MDCVYLRKISLSSVEAAWPSLRHRPQHPVTLRRARSGQWLELHPASHALAAELSERLEAEVVAFSVTWSAGFVGVRSWREGVAVRTVEYTLESGFCTVEGQAQTWETEAFSSPPQLEANDQRLGFTEGESIREALGVRGAWGPPRRLEGGRDWTHVWVPLMIVLPLLLVLLIALLA